MTKTKSITPETFANSTDEQNRESYNSKTEELIQRREMENTPFTIITLTEKHASFGTFGKYKITEDYETPEQVEAELKKMTWNRIVQIMSLVQTILTNNK